MALKYIFEDKIDELCPLSRQYQAWYATFLPSVLYPDNKDFADARTALSTDVLDWLTNIDQEMTMLSAVKVDFIKTLFTAMQSNVAALEKTPSEDGAEELVKNYTSFMAELCLAEEGEVLFRLGIDKATGLRSRAVITPDLERELDRFQRHGGAFCAAIARMDQFEEIGGLYGKDGQQKYLTLTADIIKESLRSFDEGYYIGEGEFVLCFKQADITGGMAALERLRRVLDEKSHTINIEGKDVPLSLACCVVEPYPGDDVAKLMKNLREDLQNIEKSEGGGVLEFLDESPLQRFAKNQAADSHTSDSKGI